MPASAPTDRPSRFRLSRRAGWLLAGGFGLGLLIFLLLWWDMRSSSDFYRAQGKQASDDGQVFDPLPAPTADGSRSASGMGDAAEAARAARRAPPPAQIQTPAQAPAPQADAGDTPEPRASAPGREPVPVRKVQPDYPGDALRNNETGKVVVRIEVGADGTPEEVSIARSSRSRSLDRAALEAARKWRFRPAQDDGGAPQGAVEVPFEFTLEER